MVTLIRGDNRTLLATVYTDSTKTTVQDLTAALGIRFTVRKLTSTGGMGQVVFEKDLTDGITVTNAVGGLMQIAVEPDDTNSLSAVTTTLVYDIEITWVSGNITTVDKGSLTVTPDVSWVQA